VGQSKFGGAPAPPSRKAATGLHSVAGVNFEKKMNKIVLNRSVAFEASKYFFFALLGIEP